MTHAELSEALSERIVAYALGALDDAAASELETHVDQCAICRRELDEMRATLSLLPHGLEPAPPSPACEARLMERVSGGGL